MSSIFIHQQRKRGIQFGMVIAVMLAISGLDIAFGSQISPWALYILPILAATLLFGLRQALVLVLLATLFMALAAEFAGHPFASRFYLAIALANRTLSLAGIAWLAAYALGERTKAAPAIGTGIGNY